VNIGKPVREWEVHEEPIPPPEPVEAEPKPSEAPAPETPEPVLVPARRNVP